MDVRELEKALKHKLGPYVRFIGIYASDRIPFIQYSAKPGLLIAEPTLILSDTGLHFILNSNLKRG